MRNGASNLLKAALKAGVCFLDQTGSAASDARDRVAEGFDRASDHVSDFGDRASRKLSDLGDRARDLYPQEDHTMRNVLMFGAGIAVGAGIGMLMAPASGEETRDEIRAKVHEFGGRVKDRVKEKVSQVMPTGTDGV